MLPLRFDSIRSVLCLGAHSDDIEIGCGGTLIQLLSKHPQLKVHWVVFSGEESAAAEARTSAAELLAGAANTHIVVQKFRDSYFPYIGTEIKDCFKQLAKEVNPDLVFTHRQGNAHQDHRLIAELTANAFRNHLILGYEIPKYDGDSATPNCYVPIDEATVRRKDRPSAAAFPLAARKAMVYRRHVSLALAFAWHRVQLAHRPGRRL